MVAKRTCAVKSDPSAFSAPGGCLVCDLASFVVYVRARQGPDFGLPDRREMDGPSFTHITPNSLNALGPCAAAVR